MTVKNILKLAAEMLSLGDVKKELQKTETVVNGDIERLIECYNLVISELCEEYVSVKKTEQIEATGGKFYFSSFAEIPTEILQCYVNGVKTDFKTTPLYLVADASEITVEYAYYPQKQDIDGICPYKETEVSERVIALGIAREFSLFSGQISEAEIFDERYQKAVSSLVVSKRSLRMKARGWY